jgi:hypothetical protein
VEGDSQGKRGCERGCRRRLDNRDGWRHGRGRGRRCCGRAEPVYNFLVLSRVKNAAQEDVFPPERQDERRVVFVYLSSSLRGLVYGGQAGGDIGDGRAVCGEGVELEMAGVLHLLDFRNSEEHEQRGGSSQR